VVRKRKAEQDIEVQLAVLEAQLRNEQVAPELEPAQLAAGTWPSAQEALETSSQSLYQ
jgi:hypothetical protein